MPTIEKGREVLTLINVFTVEPDKQLELVSFLTEAARQTMRHLPGFVSANIHRSLDGTRVVNYVQWRGMTELQAAQKNSEAKARAQAVTALGRPDAALYEVVETIETPSEMII